MLFSSPYEIKDGFKWKQQQFNVLFIIEVKISDNNRTKDRRGGEVPITRFQYQRQVLSCHVRVLGLTAAIHPIPRLSHPRGLCLYLPSVWPDFKADVTPGKAVGWQQLSAGGTSRELPSSDTHLGIGRTSSAPASIPLHQHTHLQTKPTLYHTPVTML